jgi:hypothetical protein
MIDQIGIGRTSGSLSANKRDVLIWIRSAHLHTGPRPYQRRIFEA